MRAVVYRLTTPWFMLLCWVLFVAWMWNEEHQALLRGAPVLDPANFITLCLFVMLPFSLGARLHRWMLPPAPPMRRPRGKAPKPVPFSLVRVAVPRRRWVGSPPGEAAMRRRLSPALQALVHS